MLFIILTIVGSCFIKSITKEKKIPIPYSFLLLIYGLFIGILTKYIFLEEHRKSMYSWANLDPHIMLSVFIPPLIYESSFNIDYHTIKKLKYQILFLAIPCVLFSSCLTGLVIKLFESSFNRESAFLLGSILSATDPIAVINILKTLGVSHKLLILIEGESLLNDGTAYCLFVILEHAIEGHLTFEFVVGKFCLLTFGGLAVGLFLGFIFNEIIKRIFNNEDVELSLSIISCYITFYISEKLLGCSGILSIVAHGLYISYTRQTGFSPNLTKTLEHIWSFLSSVINNIIFVLAGLIIFLEVSYENISGYDIGGLILLYLSISVIRFIMIGVFYLFFQNAEYGISKVDALILSLSGLRGEITLLLSLIVKLEFHLSEEVKDKICFYSSGIVILTILINSYLVKYVVNKYMTNKEHELVLDERILHVKEHLSNVNNELICKLKQNEFFLKTDWDKIDQKYKSHNNSDVELNIMSDDEKKQEEDVMIESRKIFLQCLKKQYWCLFDRHMIYKDVVVKLIEIVDNVLDTEDLDWSMSISPYCSTRSDSYWNRFLDIQILNSCFGKCFQIYNIKHNYNIVVGYIMGQREVLTKLCEVIDNIEIFEKLEKCSQKSEQMGIKFLKKIEKIYPKLVSEIETNQVSYMILKNQEMYLNKLYNDGELSEKLYEKFIHDIHKQEYILHL